MKNKKLISLICVLIILIPNIAFAKVTVIDDNRLVDNNNVLIKYNLQMAYQITNQISIRDVQRSVRRLDIEIPFDFTIHILDYAFPYSMTIGFIHGENEFAILDFLPFQSKIILDDVVSHEIGHLVYNKMNDWDLMVYKHIRGIPEDWNDYSEYLHRPTEIFAEDFRVLYGGTYGSFLDHATTDLEVRYNRMELREFIEFVLYK
jgi:hypothetical protein